MGMRCAAAVTNRCARAPRPRIHRAQAAGTKPFSLDASLAVLRLYALQPSVARPDTVAKILLRALAQAPANDYRTCLFLVPERMQVWGTIGGSGPARRQQPTLDAL